MYKNIKKQTNKKKAFTLIEALVAISILMIAIASPMTLAQKGLSTATLSKDQMIASFLAQDGIEAVKNIRDQIAVRGSATNDWLDLLSNCTCSSDADCNFDSSQLVTFCTIDTTASIWNSSTIQRFTGIANAPKLKKSYYTDPSTNVKNFIKYDYSGTEGAEDSIFYRYINIRETPMIDESGKHNEAVVSVRISWGSPLGVQKIDIQDFIYNYSENL